MNANTSQPQVITQAATIKERLAALLDVVVRNSKFSPAFIPVIKSLAMKFLNNATEDDLRDGIIELREKYLPWILGEKTEAQDEDTIKK